MGTVSEAYPHLILENFSSKVNTPLTLIQISICVNLDFYNYTRNQNLTGYILLPTMHIITSGRRIVLAMLNDSQRNYIIQISFS